MMSKTADYQDAAVDGAQVVELPYVDDEAAMMVVLRDEGTELRDLEDALIAEQLAVWVDQLHESEVWVKLPRFTLEHEVPLKETTRLGRPRKGESRALPQRREVFVGSCRIAMRVPLPLATLAPQAMAQ